MKTRMLICILGLLAFTLIGANAFAQAPLTISSVPRTTAISTGHTEIAGDILASSPGAGGLGAGTATLTIDYGVPITVPASFITICGTGTLPGGGASCGGGTQYTVSTAGTPGTFQIGGSNANQLLIVMPATAAGGGIGSITVTGVKVSLAAFTGTKLTATLGVSAPTTFGAYSIVSGQNTTDVISLVAPAFTTAVATGATATPLPGVTRATVLTTTTVSNRDFNIDVPENFVDAFRTTAGQNGYLNDPGLIFTFNNIPNGVFLNLLGAGTGTSNQNCTNAPVGAIGISDQPILYSQISGTTQAIPAGNLSNSLISNTANTAILSFTGINFNPTVLETIRLRGCVYTSGATAPLTAGTITATVSMTPNGSALQNGVAITPVAGNFPRYQFSPVSVNAVDILAAETDMLISFAVRNTSGFDTGISIANTSSDPFGTTNGVTPNDGTCTLNFYPQGTGSSFTYTTAAGSPGLGLSSAGVLVGGKTWTVGLSELLGTISGAPTSFTGYIFVRCAFTNAHGAAYVTDYKGFTSSSPFLIVPLGRGTVNEALGH